MYNYLEAVTDDVREAIREEYDRAEIVAKLATSRDKWEEALNASFWTYDNITGNASGSYTFCTYTAEDYLCHNMNILAEACEEFGDDVGDALRRGGEFCDATIRCYYLSQAIAEVLDELADEYADDIEAYEEDEDEG